MERHERNENKKKSGKLTVEFSHLKALCYQVDGEMRFYRWQAC
jgi:hypothetical protein